MKYTLDEINISVDSSHHNIAELKVENNTTDEGINSSMEASTALKNEFSSLIDRLNMTSGKLNVIEERAERVKNIVINIDTELKQKEKNMFQNNAEQMTENDIRRIVNDVLSSHNGNVESGTDNGVSKDDVVLMINEKLSNINITSRPQPVQSGNPDDGDGDDSSSEQSNGSRSDRSPPCRY